jgi:hypothetical protein
VDERETKQPHGIAETTGCAIIALFTLLWSVSTAGAVALLLVCFGHAAHPAVLFGIAITVGLVSVLGVFRFLDRLRAGR